MSTVDSAIKSSSISTVAESSATQARERAEGAANTDVDSTIDRLNATRNEINQPPSDGDFSIKEIQMAQAQTDINLSQTEFVVYDGEISFNNIELGAVRSQLATKEAQLAAEEAKQLINTSINGDGNAEFTMYDGMRIVTDTNKGGNQTWIYDASGEQIMHVHGDPHVNNLKDGNNGDDFHFGDDSTIVFNNGVELTFNTTEVDGQDGVYYTTGIYVKSGNNVMHTGEESNGNSRAEVAKVDADSYVKKGDAAEGAVIMGMTDEGMMVMKNGAKWNELKDESWDAYLADKTFTDQKGAEVDYKPAEFADLSALRSEILALQGKEQGYVDSVAALTPMRSSAESNLTAANADYENFSAMEDSEFVDNDETRFNIEQKNLSLSQRANNLGLFLSDSPLVTSENFSSLGVTEGDLLNDSIFADRSQRQNQITYMTGTFEGSGFEDINAGNTATNNLVNSLRSLVDASGFEAASIQNDATVETEASVIANNNVIPTTTAGAAQTTDTAQADENIQRNNTVTENV